MEPHAAAQPLCNVSATQHAYLYLVPDAHFYGLAHLWAEEARFQVDRLADVDKIVHPDLSSLSTPQGWR